MYMYRYQVALTSQCRQHIKTAVHKVVWILDLLVLHIVLVILHVIMLPSFHKSILLRYCSMKATYVIEQKIVTKAWFRHFVYRT